MKRTLVICAAALALGAGLVLPTSQAHAGCDINVSVRNADSAEFDIRPSIQKVKIKGGTWRRLDKGYWGSGNRFEVDAGETYTDVYQAGFGCNKKRRYRFWIDCPDGSHRSVYYPSANGWTERQSFTASLSC